MSDESAIIRNFDTIQEILRNVCDRNELAFLSTPYAKFELNFLLLDQEVVHVTATMSREDALYGLKSPSLTLRFPHGPRIFRASTSLLGIGMARGRKSLRLSRPAVLESDEFRRAFRVEKVGRIQVTFSSRKYDLLTGSLVNISTGGARIFSSREFEDGEILLDDVIHVSIPLTPGILINGQAKVRHVGDRSVGLEFRPTLSGNLLDDLSRWTFQKKEEAYHQFASREQEKAGDHAAKPAFLAEGPCIALVGGPPDLEERLRTLLAGLPPLHRYPATVQTMRALTEAKGVMALVYLDGADHEHRARAGTLLEPIRGKVPFFLLGGAGLGASVLLQLANDWEALMGFSIEGQGLAQLAKQVGGVFSYLVR
ncbi:PilZ domain-containing protein [Geothrix sp. 21YS21S-2]|uniref:PilZ domain-containing protein n=1 Tax=Geothrix sp. 21YS21S-2 TaxID=3068893 RepID=UPI0027BAA1D5|nr:PilZ domain-containing protein [Geothrix sp. 21YS21S-2]